MAIFIIRMKFHKSKFLTTVTAVALVLAVGACGSSNDDEMALVVNGDDAATNGGDAATNGGDAATNGGDAATNGDDDAKTPAETLATAQAGYDALTDASTDEERAAAMTALEEALMLAGNEAAYIAYLEEQVTDQNEAAAATAAATAGKEASDKAALVLLALDPDMTTRMAPGVMLAASSSSVVKATVAGYAEHSAYPDAISGFRGKILTKDGAELHVYTNIEDAAATRIDDIYKHSSPAGKPKAYTVTDIGSPSNQDINWGDVKRDDSTEDVDKSGDVEVTTFAGSVRGLDGVFSCSGDDNVCGSPDRNTNGSVVETGIMGMWTFTPTDEDGMIDIADGDLESKDGGYLQFGWWLNMMGDDVKDGFDVDTFTGVTGMVQSEVLQSGGVDGVDGVEGSATYTGGAAGKWAIASTTEDTTEGGHFTATATLGVNFDAHFSADSADDAEEVNKNGVSVSGSITDFMTGERSRPSWKVTLTVDSDPDAMGAQSAETLPVTFPDGNATTKWTTGGAVDGVGTWTANFHGSEKDTSHPTAVVGTFHAAIAGGDVGRIQGAFGATKE